MGKGAIWVESEREGRRFIYKRGGKTACEGKREKGRGLLGRDEWKGVYFMSKEKRQVYFGGLWNACSAISRERKKTGNAGLKLEGRNCVPMRFL